MWVQGRVGRPQAGHAKPDSLTLPPIQNFGFCILQSSLWAHLESQLWKSLGRRTRCRCGLAQARQGQPLPGIFPSPTCGLFQEGLPVLDGLVNVLLAVHNLIIQSLGGGGKKPRLRNFPGKELRALRKTKACDLGVSNVAHPCSVISTDCSFST